MQKRLKISIDNYKNYSQLYSSIEIELKYDILKYATKHANFINIPIEEKNYYHIYDSKGEINY